MWGVLCFFSPARPTTPNVPNLVRLQWSSYFTAAVSFLWHPLASFGMLSSFHTRSSRTRYCWLYCTTRRQHCRSGQQHGVVCYCSATHEGIYFVTTAALTPLCLQVIQAAKGRPVVLLNPRMIHMPRETNDYDTVYLLRQFNVHPIKSDPRVRVTFRKTPSLTAARR